MIENRELAGLARRVAQPEQMRMRRLAQIHAARDDVAEHEAFDAELIRAVVLDEKAGLFEGREQPERCRARDARPRRQIGERQARFAEGKDAEQLQRLGRGVNRVARRRDDFRAPFHWVKRYIVP